MTGHTVRTHSPLGAPGCESLTTTDTVSKLPGVHSLYLRTWPPGSVQELLPLDNVVRLMLVIEGILTCEHPVGSSRVLPREVLCVDGEQTMRVKNLSSIDASYAIEINLLNHQPARSPRPHHRYFSDDQKDNKLCLVASPVGNGGALHNNSSVELYLTQLQQYESVLLESHEQNAVAALVIRGMAKLDEEPVHAGDPILVSSAPISISGGTSTEVLSVRQLGSQAA